MVDNGKPNSKSDVNIVDTVYSHTTHNRVYTQLPYAIKSRVRLECVTAVSLAPDYFWLNGKGQNTMPDSPSVMILLY